MEISLITPNRVEEIDETRYSGRGKEKEKKKSRCVIQEAKEIG